MMMVLYKIFAKAIAPWLSLVTSKVMTPNEHGFAKGRSIYDNVLAALIGIDYAKLSKQECILLQLDLDKTYDKLGRLFIAKTMEILVFGERMCQAVIGVDNL